MAILKKGTSGEPVKRLQTKLGVTADGIFGSGTEAALKVYQQKEGIAVDGVAGPDTFAHMGLHELILLRKGSKGELVKKLQQALAIAADGAFGSGTEKAVKEYQASKGLKVDGLAGPATLATMELFTDVTEKTVELSKADAAAGGGSIWDRVTGLFD